MNTLQNHRKFKRSIKLMK